MGSRYVAAISVPPLVLRSLVSSPRIDLIFFHEYFHGDTGAGLGALHQAGWTGLIADLIKRARPRVLQLSTRS